MQPAILAAFVGDSYCIKLFHFSHMLACNVFAQKYTLYKEHHTNTPALPISLLPQQF